MRALLVTLSLAFAAVANVAASGPVALHAGDRVTDRDLFSYLAFAVRTGDWVRYRVVFADRTTVMKTIGFGSESVGGVPTLYIETHVSALPVTGLPPGSTVGIGTDAVLKTYVSGSSFGDLARPYHVVTSALKIGDFEYEVAPGSDQTYTALAGSVYAEPRDGTVQDVEPVDVRVGNLTVHATHVGASFPQMLLPVGGIAMAFSLAVWQSPDVPLGTVAISSAGSRAVRWRLVAFGRGDYRSRFARTLDRIRTASQPVMP